MPATPEGVRAWGKHAHGSPLYAHLVEVVAGDEALMSVLNRIEHLPQMNLLMAGVHYMLMRGDDPGLAAWYRSLVDDPLPVDQVDSSFRSFVLEHEEELVSLGNTRYTQTNECRRCIALMPGAMTASFERFHLVEIGTSAGLNLAMDRYHYRYGDLEWGPESTVILDGEWRGRRLPLHEIEVLSRIGLDLNPILPDDSDARQWLDALIWPEHTERRARLRKALALVSGLDLDLVAGNALETLPAVLDRIPSGEPVVVMNAFTLGQFTQEGRARVEEICETARAGRPLHRVSMEVLDKDDDWARLSAGSEGPMAWIGQAQPHGEWIELWDQARP